MNDDTIEAAKIVGSAILSILFLIGVILRIKESRTEASTTATKDSEKK